MYEKIPKYQIRRCRECGKKCWGFTCSECYSKNNRGQLTRRQCNLRNIRRRQLAEG